MAVFHSDEFAEKRYLLWCTRHLPREILPESTPAQYERGLPDKDWKVREAWAKRTDLTPTHEQYARGLVGGNYRLRFAWAKRTDLTPTPEQYERGLTDEVIWVRAAWEERKQEKETK